MGEPEIVNPRFVRSGQSLTKSTLGTLIPAWVNRMEPKINNDVNQANAGFPKVRKRYGNGGSIVGQNMSIIINISRPSFPPTTRREGRFEMGRRELDINRNMNINIGNIGLEVNQRSYSTRSCAVTESNGTNNEMSITKLDSDKFTGLYKQIMNRNFLISCYDNIKSKPGNITPGTDGITLDGFTIRDLDQIICSLEDESFVFKPSRRVIIPKTNGKIRPLAIASPRDKIVQEAIREILNAIYDPLFIGSSHGFRQGRSCHSALKEIST